MQYRFQQVQNELFSMKKLPKANTLEMQHRPDDKKWEAESAIASGVSSPAFGVNSQCENHVLKQNFVNELQIRNKELRENNITLKSNCDQVQDELFQVEDKWKLALQEQTYLSEKLCDREKEIRSLIEDLTKEKDKSKNLRGDLNKINQDLANTQKLLRQYHIKKVNWGNFYGDLEKDYYNGLNFPLERI